MSDLNEGKQSTTNYTITNATEVGETMGEAAVKSVTINMQIFYGAVTSIICTIVTIFCAAMLLNPKWLIDIIFNWVPDADITLMRFALKLHSNIFAMIIMIIVAVCFGLRTMFNVLMFFGAIAWKKAHPGEKYFKDEDDDIR